VIWALANAFFLFSLLAGLKQVIQGDGVWRIRKLEKSHVIQVYKVEESGHGDILSSAFKTWRESLVGNDCTMDGV
jgi:RAT1-interacting protein